MLNKFVESDSLLRVDGSLCYKSNVGNWRSALPLANVGFSKQSKPGPIYLNESRFIARNAVIALHEFSSTMKKYTLTQLG